MAPSKGYSVNRKQKRRHLQQLRARAKARRGTHRPWLHDGTPRQLSVADAGAELVVHAGVKYARIAKLLGVLFAILVVTLVAWCSR